MVKILCMIPHISDGTSFYRGLGPLSHLRKTTNIELLFHDRIDWTVLKLVDCLFMQRPSTTNDLKIAISARNLGIPVWVDYDDDLFHIPTDNPAFAMYSHPEIKDNIEKIMRIASVMSVTTGHLSASLKSYCDNIHVIENALDESLLSQRIEIETRNKPLIMWRGSATHQGDLISVQSELEEYFSKYRDCDLEFFGYYPWFLENVSFKFTPGKDILEYFKYLRMKAPDFFICPLAQHTFNLSKSNIAWIEATLAGSVMLAPDFPEWKRPGVMTYSGDFCERLEEMTGEFFERHKMHALSYEYIMDCLKLSQINDKRINLLEEIL